MIKNVLFDLDGTLIDSLEVWDEVDLAFLKKRGLEMSPEYKEALTNLHFDLAADYTIAYYHLNESKQAIMDDWLNLAISQYTYHVNLNPGVMELLDCLKNQGIHLYIVTSCMEELYWPCLKRLGIEHYFKAIMDTQEIPISKGSPQFYHEVLNKLNLKANQCLFIDDILENVEAARKAGIKSFHASINYNILELLEEIK